MCSSNGTCPKFLSHIPLGILIVILYSFCSPVFAARTASISSNKTSLFGDEEMVVTASTSGFVDGETIYIKGAFFQSGSTNYFGYTKNEDAWTKNGETSTTQRKVKVGEWDGTFNVRSDFSDSGYHGEGDYGFKFGFYYTTGGNNLSSVNWSTNILTVALNEPDPTPTLTPMPTQVPTATSKPISTNTPLPSPTRAATPSVVIPTSSAISIASNAGTGGMPETLGESTEGAGASSVATGRSSMIRIFAVALLLIGCGLALIALLLFWKKWYPTRLVKGKGKTDDILK